MIEFFRDTLSGVYYYIYIVINLIFIFALIGYIGERKEKDLSKTEVEENSQQNIGNNE
ncbi:MAG: hypothetical protein ACI4OG_02785 [Bacilli bacterium]